jgi:glycosyltransferase involved in cell wall biosynthesis
MMNTPLVSVLMTAYNREQYVAEAIESVLASTLADWELFVVDDASTDRTVEIARRYTVDPRVQVHVNERNLGDYPNRNRAASFARGKFLKYLDSDDTVYPHGLGVMLDRMQRHPDAALGMCRLPNGAASSSRLVQPEQAYRKHFFGGGLLLTGPSGCIIRADAFWAVNGFGDTRYAGDTEMWLRLASRYSLVLLSNDLVWWRVHPGQEYWQGVDSLAYAFMNYRVSMDALADPCCPLRDDEREKAIRRVRHHHARLIWRLALRQGRLRSALDLYRDSCLSLLELARGLRRPDGTGQT